MHKAYALSKVAEQNKKELELEIEKSEKILLNVMPASVLARLKDDKTIFDSVKEASVMFIHISNFETLKKTTNLNTLLKELNMLFSKLDEMTEYHQCEKIKSIGSSFLVVSGCPRPTRNHALYCAQLALVSIFFNFLHD